MAPKTRSNRKTPAPSAPTPTTATSKPKAGDRVYRRKSASPALQQVHFPPRRRVVKHTYGRRAGASAAALKQQTMTQMAFLVPSSEPEEEDEEEEELKTKVEVKDYVEEKRPSKRRKTMGDPPSSSYQTQTLTQFLSTVGPGEVEDSENEEPISPVRQDEAVTAKGKGKAGLMVPQTPSSKRVLEAAPSVFLSPSVRMLIRNSSPLSLRRSPLKDKSTNSAVRTPAVAMSTKKRTPVPKDRVIPDSYSTAGLSSSGRSLVATPSPRKRRTPLGELRLSEVKRRDEARVSSAPRASGAPRAVRDEIPDSDDELVSLGPTPKRVDFEIAASEESSPGPVTPTRPRRALKRMAREVENEEDEEDEFQPGSPTPLARRVSQVPSSAGKENVVPAAAEPTTPPRPLRPTVTTQQDENRKPAQRDENRTPAQRDENRTPAQQDENQTPAQDENRTPTPVAKSQPKSSILRNIEIEDSDSEPITPSLVARKTQSQDRLNATIAQSSSLRNPSRSIQHDTIDISSDRVSSAVKETQHRAEIPSSEADDDETPFSSLGSRPVSSHVTIQTTPVKKTQPRISPRKTQAYHTQAHRTQAYHTQAYTQLLESQRVPMAVLRKMAPQTARSDVVITMHPSRVREVVEGVRNHEFRAKKLLASVSRLWIYVARPDCELRYMATVGPAKRPGDIDSSTGLGNREFNEGKGSNKWAYELEQVYELNNPVPLERMRENGWTESGAGGLKYLPPAVVGQLLANLQRELFDNGDELEESVSQQVEAQIHSDIAHSTQLALMATDVGEDEEGEVVPSSQEPLPPQRTAMPPPQPPSSTRRHSQRNSQRSSQQWAELATPRTTRSSAKKAAAAVSFSQATTASQSSTQAAWNESPVDDTPRPRPEPVLVRSSSGVVDLPEYGVGGSDESVATRRTLRSSQFLPESLIRDDERQPPVVLDSEDEGDEDMVF